MITGGAQGVGLGIAREFVEQAATVVITGRRQAPLDEAVASLGPRSSGVVADVSRDGRHGSLVQDRDGATRTTLDAVVANAGVGDSAPLGSITEKQFDHIFGINVKGCCSPFSRP